MPTAETDAPQPAEPDVEDRRDGTRPQWRWPARGDLLALVPLAIVVLLPLRGLWLAAGPPMEEGFMLVFPERVLAGDVPNRDFLHLYGPGSLWVLALAFVLGGATLGVQRLVGLAQHVGVATGIYVLLRPWGRAFASVGACIAALIIITPTGLSALAWIGGVALGLWCVNAAAGALEADEERARRRRTWAAGLLAGAALLYRLDLALAVGAALLVTLVLLPAADRRRLVLAAVAGVSPYLLHLAMAGPGNVVRGMLIEPVFELRGGRRLPLPPSWDDFDGFLQRAGLLDEPPWPFPALRGPVQLNLWLLAILLGAFATLVAGWWAHRDGRPRLLILAVFGAGLLPQALQRADSTHLSWVSCVTFAVLPVALVELARRGRAHSPTSTGTGRRARGAAVGAVLVPLVLLAAVLPDFTVRSYADAVGQSFGHRRNAGVMAHEGRTFRYARADAVDAVNALLPLVDSVTEPGDRLFVGPGDLRKTPYSEAFLYHLLPDLVPATRFIEMDPGIANAEGSGLAEELRSADVVILSSIRDDWNEPNDSLEFGSNEPNEVLERHFCLRASYGEGLFGRGLYEVWTPC
jgi:hypothetical protein